MNKEILPQDQEFMAKLVAHCEVGSCIPLWFNDDGTLNREKVLDGSQFADAKEKFK
jgi:hypothetical protein